jgi:hypothetical protein
MMFEKLKAWWNADKIEKEKWEKLLKKIGEESDRSMEYLDWFVEGRECPRCGGTESETEPKPHQCEKCGTWFGKSVKKRTCLGCGLTMQIARE